VLELHVAYGSDSLYAQINAEEPHELTDVDIDVILADF